MFKIEARRKASLSKLKKGRCYKCFDDVAEVKVAIHFFSSFTYVVHDMEPSDHQFASIELQTQMPKEVHFIDTVTHSNYQRHCSRCVGKEATQLESLKPTWKIRTES